MSSHSLYDLSEDHAHALKSGNDIRKYNGQHVVAAFQRLRHAVRSPMTARFLCLSIRFVAVVVRCAVAVCSSGSRRLI